MKRAVLLILVVFFSMAPAALGEVSTKMRLSDGNTPFLPADTNSDYTIYPDIMVGTKLTVIIDSNLAEYWAGGALVLEEADMNKIGNIYGRGYNGFSYPNSCLPPAGEFAAVYDTYVYSGPGFEVYVDFDPNAGDWFIFDYNALDIGDCNISFYDDLLDYEPAHTLMFHHVRTRDFNGDTTVNFFDYAVLASHWRANDCNEPDWCQGTDLDVSGSVDVNDLARFCEFWLAKTEE